MSYVHSRVDVLSVAVQQCLRLQLRRQHLICIMKITETWIIHYSPRLEEKLVNYKDTIWSPAFMILYQTLCKVLSTLQKMHSDDLLAVLMSSLI